MKRLKSKFAFSLIEILIVVCILGILAAIIVPHYISNSILTKEAAAKETLHTLRTQIDIYTLDHHDLPPGYISSTLHDGLQAILQLAYCTDVDGKIWEAKIPSGEYKYGPYLINEKILNPFNKEIAITIVANMPETPDGSSGWLFHPDSNEIRLNWPGKDSQGQLYYDY